ncbi:MAG: thiamine ABC transporter substrate-binding protein [Treponema sp.]|nr:thiamine ABC transporter substrate-binding protein [Treponema sp.]
MKKNTFVKFISVSMAFAALLVSCKSKKTSEERLNEVVVYTYDSFAGEWGPGPELVKLFKEKTGYTLNLVDCGDAVQAYNRAVLEKKDVQADVVLGIDNNLAPKALKEGILESYKPLEADNKVLFDLRHEESLGGNWNLTPFDYGYFAIIYDTQSSVPAPKSLEDLTLPVYEKKIILMDPRTSTPGLGFASWTAAVYGEKLSDYWKALKPNILTMTSGWSEGWGMFQNGEAPLCISYNTSPAYNVEYENNDRYVTLIFDEGHVMQVEGFGLLKNAPNKKGAKAFMDFMISIDAQKVLPLTQWMYPANHGFDLPESYKTAAPLPTKVLEYDASKNDDYVQTIMDVLGK